MAKHKMFTFNILFIYAFHATDSYKIISGDNLMSISEKGGWNILDSLLRRRRLLHH